jgi:hypothetical protein
MTRDLETHDIVLAAALKTLGYQLSTIEKIGNRGIFHFSDVDSSAITDYDLGRLLVEPATFNAAIKSLTTASRRTL